MLLPTQSTIFAHNPDTRVEWRCVARKINSPLIHGTLPRDADDDYRGAFGNGCSVCKTVLVETVSSSAISNFLFAYKFIGRQSSGPTATIVARLQAPSYNFQSNWNPIKRHVTPCDPLISWYRTASDRMNNNTMYV